MILDPFLGGILTSALRYDLHCLSSTFFPLFSPVNHVSLALPIFAVFFKISLEEILPFFQYLRIAHLKITRWASSQ